MTADPTAEMKGALLARDVAKATALLEAGLDPNARVSGFPWGFNVFPAGDEAPLLAVAAAVGSVELVLLLLGRGAKVEAQVSRERNYQTHDDSFTVWDATALHTAAKEGHSGVVRVLLAAGAPLEARDDMGQTPLAVAAFFGRAEALDALLEAGARTDVTDTNGDTPAKLAAACNHTALVARLESAVSASGTR